MMRLLAGAIRPLCAGLVLVLGSTFLAAQDDLYAEDLKEANRALLRGKLARARVLFEEILEAAKEEPPEDRPDAVTARTARQGLLTIELRRGRYEDVAGAVAALPERERADRGFVLLGARAAMRLGRYEEAIAALRGLLERDPRDLEARWRLGLALRAVGRRDDVLAVWRRALELEAERSFEEPLQLAWLGRILGELGGRENLELASQYLARSIDAAPERPEARIGYGILNYVAYAEANGFPSGERQLKKVLEQNGDVEEALIWLYRIRKSNFQLDPARTESYLERALAVNPRSVPALVERGAVQLDDRRFDEAAATLDRALAIDPRDKYALAHRAAAALLMNRHDEYDSLRARAFAVDAGFFDMDRLLGDHLVALYRFGDAVPFYRKSLEAAPEWVPTLHGLAKALIYRGRGEDAVELLERAARLQKGYVNPWRNNALAVERLLAEQYVTVETNGFRFKMHRDDVDVLREYMLPLHEEARAVLGAKYGHVPAQPVTVEVFHTWPDFSVRTIGFRGFSALGACFGALITLVSPVDRDLRRLDFVWAATVWHEYAHVLTLALSKHRVPRWLTEGFSVYEEKARDPLWERGMDRELLDAWHNGEIPPLRLMNRLFRGPRILFGYYLSGQMVGYLSREFGFDKVVALLAGYAEDLSTEAAFRRAFGFGTREFDRRFAEFVRRKVSALKIVPRYSDRKMAELEARLVARPDDVATRVALGWALAQRDIPTDAAEQLRRALAVDPGDGRALLLWAELQRRRGALREAAETYRKGFATGVEDFDSRIAFGRLLERQGDVAGAIEQYQLAKRCWPTCTEQNNAPALLLARLLRKQGRETEALMELKAYCQRTGRAFAPRLQLAELEKKAGNRESEARYLEQAVQIDPFMRELHVRLADAYLALAELEPAARELRVALAVPPALDRAHLNSRSGPPDPNSPGEREARAALCVSLAKVLRRLKRTDEARRWLERARRESPDGDAAAEAAELDALWRR